MGESGRAVSTNRDTECMLRKMRRIKQGQSHLSLNHGGTEAEGGEQPSVKGSLEVKVYED